MSKSALIVGCGKQAEAIGYHLLVHGEFTDVKVVDYNAEAAVRLGRKLASVTPRRHSVRHDTVDATDVQAMTVLMQSFDVCTGAADYRLNRGLTQAAIASKTHFVDLGGNNTVVQAQFDLSEEAKRAGVRIAPDCGIAPGAVSTITKYLMEKLGRVPKKVSIYVGGLPQKPEGELGYAIVFSVRGLTNEYLEQAEVLRDGKLTLVDSLTQRETGLVLDLDIPALEAEITSGGCSTLCKTYEGVIETLDYKTLRYPGHWDKIHTLKNLGFFSETPLNIPGSDAGVPRLMTEAVLSANLSHGVKDILAMRIEVSDDDGSCMANMIDHFNDGTGHTAMQRTTGFSAAIIANMLVQREVSKLGTITQELHVPASLFVKRWTECGLKFDVFSEGVMGTIRKTSASE